MYWLVYIQMLRYIHCMFMLRMLDIEEGSEYNPLHTFCGKCSTKAMQRILKLCKHQTNQNVSA